MNYDLLVKKIEDNGNVLTVKMSVIRDVTGAKKLGKLVIDDVARELSARQIGWDPTLVTDQNYKVRLYKKGTLVGGWMDAFKTRDEESDTVIKDALSKKRKALLNELHRLTND